MSKEENILNAIYHGKISICEKSVTQTDEYKNIVKQSTEQYELLKSLLDEKGENALESFLNTKALVGGYFEEQRFNDGFVLGAKLMMEILKDRSFSAE